MIDIVQNNPFRVLGVYGNASAKDLAANQSKLTAYANVGKAASFPLDKAVEAPLARSAEDIAKATQAIQLPEDKIKYALFWFAKGTTDINLMACQHLEAGNREKAKELFGKQSNIASLINLSVLALCDGDNATAVRNMMQLLHNSNYRNSLARNLAGELFQRDEAWFSQLYMDVLMKELPGENWLKIFTENGGTESDIAYLRQAKTGEPIRKIESEVAQAKSVDKKDANANLQAGRKLMRNTKTALRELQSLLPKTDVQYQMVVDKLATTILQCGINYYNMSNDDESPVNAMELQKYALDIAVGKMAVDRCKENVNILQKAVDAMPPVSVAKYAKTLAKLLSDFQNSTSDTKGESLQWMMGQNKKSTNSRCDATIYFLKQCASSLVLIKEELGRNDTYYLNISTHVVDQALDAIITEVNNAVNLWNTFSDNPIGASKSRNWLKATVSGAWQVTLCMDCLDMESSYKTNRYNQQRKSLKQLVDNIIPSNMIIGYLDMRTETEIFNGCRTIKDYENYIGKYPMGKYATKARQKIVEIQRREEERKLQEQRIVAEVSEKLKMCNTFQSLTNIKDQYSGWDRAVALIDDKAFSICNLDGDYEFYIQHFTKHKAQAKQKLKEIKDKQETYKTITWICAVLLGIMLIALLANC